MGDYASVAAPSLLLNRDASARAVFISEAGENDKLAVAAAKRASSNEAVSCRFLYQESFTFLPKFKVIISTNHTPMLHESDEGTWHRLVLMPWVAQIAEADRRPDFFSRCLTPELAGIAAWMVAGSVRYWAEGLKEPAVIKDSTLEYKSSSDVFSQWLDDLVTNRTGQAKTAKLWESFANWHLDSLGEKPRLTSRSLSRWLTDKGYIPFHARDGRGFIGLSSS